MADLYLLDTNGLLRRARLNDPQHQAARMAITKLVNNGDLLHITCQNVIEFWNVLTRPKTNNGFGLTPAQADAEIHQLENFFPLLPDIPDIYKHWRQLVVTYQVSGVQVHDARLVGAMLAHGITHLLTFNISDFKRFSSITVVDPNSL
ncbi:MAG: PIN domain-containing protein [Acidobacteriota bacterium]